MKIRVSHIETELSDGSKVYAVEVSNNFDSIKLDAISREDGLKLWDAIASAISDHTNYDVTQADRTYWR